VTSSRENTPAAGKVICEHPLVAKISFTGSTAVGKVDFSNSYSLWLYTRSVVFDCIPWKFSASAIFKSVMLTIVLVWSYLVRHPICNISSSLVSQLYYLLCTLVVGAIQCFSLWLMMIWLMIDWLIDYTCKYAIGVGGWSIIVSTMFEWGGLVGHFWGLSPQKLKRVWNMQWNSA